MSQYEATVPDGARPFEFNGTTYAAGSTFQSDNPCQMLGFAQAFQAQNTTSGRTNGTPNFWQDMQTACSAAPATTPAPAPAGPPVEANPSGSGGDSATNQGAPAPAAPPAQGGTIIQDPPSPPPPPPGEEDRRPPEGEVGQRISSEQPQVQTDSGDPVDLFSGSFFLEETDIEVPNTILPLSFTRSYRSGTPSFGPLGWNWDHNYNLYIRELNNSNISLWRHLHEDVFRFNGSTFDPPRGVFEKLERVSGLSQVYEISGEGGTVMRFERPSGWVDGERIPIVRIRDRHGNTLRFTYGSEDRLAEVRDDDDRFLHLEYDACGLLVRLSDHSGRKYVYVHDEEMAHLICATSPATTDHPHGISRVYYYADPWSLPDLRHNIVRVEDSSGNVYIENEYDEDPVSFSFAGVTQQLYGPSLFQFRYTQLQFVPANDAFVNIPSVQVEVMNPDFGLETYTFNFRGDLLDRRYRLNKDRSFRVVAVQYEFDVQGNLAITTRPDGSQEIKTYDAENPDPRMRGKLLRKELTAASGFPAPSRIIWRGKYEPLFQLLIEEKTETNAVTTYKYDFDLTPGAPTNSGKLKQIRHPNATLPDGTIQTTVTAFEHNPKGQVTALILPDGKRQEMSYGAAGNNRSRLIANTFDVGGLNIVNHVDYDTFGFDSTTTDSNGHVTVKTINALGQMERETLPAVNGIAAAHVLHYNSDKRLIAYERPRGEYTDGSLAGDFIIDTFERDVLGHPTRYNLSSNTIEPRTIRCSCDFRGFPLRTINPDGSRIDRVYDERGLLIEEAIVGTDGKRVASRKAYNRSGNLTHEIEPNGLVTRYDYDGFGRVAKMTSSNGTEVRYTWGKGEVLEAMETVGNDGFGNVRRLAQIIYSYDEKSRRTVETVQSFADNPAAAVPVTIKYFYDAGDRVEKIVDNRGGVTSFKYDGVGRLVKRTDPVGNEERYTYDNNGNLLQTDSHDKEPNGSVSIITKKHEYDERNRQTAVVEPDGSRITLEYDARDLEVRQIDYLGLVKTTKYNSFGNRLREIYDTAGLAITHQWTLDEMSRPTSYIDPTGAVSTYDFDSVGRLIHIQHANGASSVRTFNDAGNVVEEQLGSGVRFQYAYDAANRLATIRNSATVAPVGPVLDHVFAYDGLDRLVSAAVAANRVQRKYDSRGRLTFEETLGRAMTCVYDDVTGNIVKTWPDGRSEKYTSDLNGTVIKIEEVSHGPLGSGGAVIADLAPSGATYLGEAKYQGQLRLVCKYDDRKRPVELAWTSAAGMAERALYRYDKANRSRVDVMTGLNPAARYLEFDTKHRLATSKEGFPLAVPDALTQAQHDGSIGAASAAAAAATLVEGFNYDGSDARLKYTETGRPDKIYSYFTGHRIQSDGVDVFAHTADGVMNTDSHFTYESDALGRIIRIKSGAATICAIEYDALGRPSAVSEQGKPIRTFNYLGEFVEQENDNAVAVRQRTVNPATGVPIAYHVNAATRYTLFDRRLNLVGLTDTSGALLESYRYRPFGRVSILNTAGTVIPSSLFGIEPIFAGQRFLESSGLYLSKRRLMNPVHGLFLAPDPRGYMDSASLYVYAAQNPMDLVDPDGELVFLAILAVMAVGALVAGGLNAARQGIQMAEDPEKRRQGFSWGELGLSMGLGAIAAPILVVAPELAIPLAAYGVAGGINQMRHGNYATGTFDIVTSLAPFGFKGVRGSVFGRGTVIGQSRGLGPSASFATRTGRFALIENNFRNFLPSPFGRRVGLGFARVAPGGREGHTAVILENERGGFWFVEKNVGQRPDGSQVAAFRQSESPLEFYIRSTRERPFEYESIRVPRSAAERAMSYAQDRVAQNNLSEPFDASCANCSHFAGDVLAQAGFEGMGNGRASGLFSDFTNFNAATIMSYAAPFWARIPPASTQKK